MPSTGEERKPAAILLISDEPVLLAWFSRCLSEAGYRVELPHGRNVYQIIREDRPALVILDCSGERTLRIAMNVLTVMHLDRRTRSIPALVCTADRGFAGHQAMRLKSMGYSLLMKPCLSETLLRKIEQLIGRPTTSSLCPIETGTAPA